MFEAGQARQWDLGGPAVGLAEWLRASWSRWSARFDSWKDGGEEEEPMGVADPEVVAALQFLASLIPDE